MIFAFVAGVLFGFIAGFIACSLMVMVKEKDEE